ncbi:hypothetical protein FAM09_09480 [Niastella caeni]|uniref:Uncharacterized protein n=1 Tax=Niastella caeni TaxID=2569763 RepID=A0A4V4H1E5_9BACT|nr:hypothetical protein [Niastella caeni]THU40106.1 hypothetical protein FAM09_09480 [Niastella caeni]
MKKSSVNSYSPTVELPTITKKFIRQFNKRKASKHAESLSAAVPPPSEEKIKQLNSIGQEYPFCVYYKQKSNDPL